jgi:hypothetical protein
MNAIRRALWNAAVVFLLVTCGGVAELRIQAEEWWGALRDALREREEGA